MDVTAMHVLLVVVLVPAMAAKLGHAHSDRNSLEVIAVCAAALFLTAALTLDVVRALHVALPVSKRVVQVLTTLLAVGAHASLQLFYLAFVARFLPVVRLRAEAVLLSAVVASTVWFACAIAGTDRIIPGTGFYAIAFDVVTLGYIMYALLTQMYWTARYARRFADPVFRTAARLTAAGVSVLALCFVVVLGHVLSAAILSSGEPYRQFPLRGLIHLGTVVLVLGLTLPAVVTQLLRLRRFWTDARTYRELGPLWTAIADALPEIVRPRRPAGSRRPVRSSVSTAFQLRLAQCRDGYSMVSPFLRDGSEPPAALRNLGRTLRERGCEPLVDGVDDLDVLRSASAALRERDYWAPTGSREPLISNASASSLNERSRHSAP